MSGLWRTRWAAVGAAVAISLGAAGVSLTEAAVGSGSRSVFVPIEPCRLVDTRPANQVGPRSTPLGPGETMPLRVTGSTGNCASIPADATGAAMNVTAIRPSASSFLTVYPSNVSRPTASNLNWAAGDPPTANKVDVGLGADGAVKVYNATGTVHLAADLVGYYVHHTHDDRYFTKAQSDGRYVRQADADFYGFGHTLMSAVVSNGATNTFGNISFPDSGSPSMRISFGLPSNRDPSRPLRVQIPFTGTPNCSFVLSAEGVAGPFVTLGGAFLNTNWTVEGTTGGAVALGPVAPGTFDASTIVTFRSDSGSLLGPGASVELRLTRANGPADTCGYVGTGQGFSVEY